MPLYEYDDLTTGRTIELVMPVAERDTVPPHLCRRTVPSKIGLMMGARCQTDSDQAALPAFRQIEEQLGSHSKEIIEKETGFTREQLKREWSRPRTKKELGYE